MSFPGLVLVTFLVIGLTKDLADRIPLLERFGTFRYGYFVAVVIQFIIAAIAGIISAQVIFLIFVNAFFVELAAGEMNNQTVKAFMKKQLIQDSSVYDGDGPLG